MAAEIAGEERPGPKSKRAHDDITARPDGVQHALDVGGSLLRTRQEVKHGAVVPHIDGLRRQSNLGDVCLHPVNVFRRRPKPLLRYFECNLRNIQNGDVPVSSRHQIVHEGRLAGAHVNNRCQASSRCALYQGKRHLQMGTIPAHRVRSLCTIYLVPVRFRVHSELPKGVLAEFCDLQSPI